ncbi:class I SAM-dependent methyltransferase [Candidatus Electronema sp. PJ]|uniref:class I SAM-dependent methyltransferase n=1 Tax=Candidatus Electronema sp. PJ TaxID=3401572 RepID=UPI003AA981B9
MNKQSIEKVYNQYSAVYDKIFGLVFENGRNEAMKMISLNGNEKVLEVGVGTGISLTKYPRTVDIIGIDLSKEMLEKAKERVNRYSLTNVQLKIENAEEMSFAPNQFDKVIIMYVLSVTPNPEVLLDKAISVCKEGGEVIIINHFSDRKALRKFADYDFLQRVERKLGFRVYFPMDKYIQHLNRMGYADVEVRTVNYGLSRIIRIKKEKAPFWQHHTHAAQHAHAA